MASKYRQDDGIPVQVCPATAHGFARTGHAAAARVLIRSRGPARSKANGRRGISFPERRQEGDDEDGLRDGPAALGCRFECHDLNVNVTRRGPASKLDIFTKSPLVRVLEALTDLGNFSSLLMVECSRRGWPASAVYGVVRRFDKIDVGCGSQDRNDGYSSPGALSSRLRARKAKGGDDERNAKPDWRSRRSAYLYAA